MSMNLSLALNEYVGRSDLTNIKVSTDVTLLPASGRTSIGINSFGYHIYIYIYIYIHIYIYTYVYIYIHIYIYNYVNITNVHIYITFVGVQSFTELYLVLPSGEEQSYCVCCLVTKKQCIWLPAVD